MMGAREPWRGTVALALLRLKLENLFIFFFSWKIRHLKSRVNTCLRRFSDLLVPLQGHAAYPSRVFWGGANSVHRAVLDV